MCQWAWWSLANGSSRYQSSARSAGGSVRLGSRLRIPESGRVGRRRRRLDRPGPPPSSARGEAGDAGRQRAPGRRSRRRRRSRDRLGLQRLDDRQRQAAPSASGSCVTNTFSARLTSPAGSVCAARLGRDQRPPRARRPAATRRSSARQRPGPRGAVTEERRERRWLARGEAVPGCREQRVEAVLELGVAAHDPDQVAEVCVRRASYGPLIASVADWDPYAQMSLLGGSWRVLEQRNREPQSRVRVRARSRSFYSAS